MPMENGDIPTALNVNIMKRFFLLLLLVMMQTAHAQSVTYDEEPLWTDQGGVGGFTATVTFYTPEPELATGTAVVICPGGGYSMLAMGREGVEIAEWLKDRKSTRLNS